MQINPAGSGSQPKLPPQSATAGNSGIETTLSEGSGLARGETTAIGDLVGRLSISRLVELLNTGTDSRAELVAKARERLVAEEYLLPESARRAAESILGLPLSDPTQSPDHAG